MTNNDLISRAAALDAIDRERKLLIEREQYGAEHIVVHHARRQIEELPAVDAMPVVHARWIDYKDEHQCSACKETTIVDFYVWKYVRFDYCPNCGAKMDGGPDA